MATVPSVSCNPPASQFGGIREGSVFAAKRAASISWPRTCKPWPLVLWKQSEAIGSFSCCNRWRTGRSSSESHSCCRSKGGRDDDGKDVELEQQLIRTLILDNYDSYTYNLFQLLSVINGVAPIVLKNDEITFDELHHLLYEERAFHNVVISPGPGTPTRPKDIGLMRRGGMGVWDALVIGICMQLLKECADIPILGVCLGHQALGCAHGAEVVHAPEPVHGRLSEIQHNGHPLFKDIPSGAGSGFKVVRYHSLVIDAISMPEDLIPTAWTVVSDSNNVSSFKGAPSAGSFLESSAWSCNFLGGNSSTLDGVWMQSHLGEDQGMVMHNEDGSLVWRRQGSLPDLVVGNVFDGSNNQSWLTELPSVPYVKKEGALLMAMSHRHRPHHAVQFHPESVATAFGRKILENFSKITQEYWQQQPWQPAKEVAMKNSKQEVPAAQTYLGNDKNKDFSAAVPNVAGINMQWADDRVELSVNGVGQSTSAAPNVALRIHSQKLSGVAVKAENIFCELFGSGAAEDTFWLDSSTRDQGGARFSYMGGKGGPLWRRLTYSIGETGAGGILRIEDSAGHVKQKVLEEGFFDFLNKELESRTCLEADYEDFPFDFCGGYVGYLGYELKVECGVQSNSHKSSLPDAALFLADRAVVIDHVNDDIYVLALFQESLSTHLGTVKGQSGTGLSTEHESQMHCNGFHRGLQTQLESDKEAAELWTSMTIQRITALGQRGIDLAAERRQSSRFTSSINTGKEAYIPPFTTEKSKATYISDVTKCQSYIRDGESYEVCLTTQLRRKTNDLDTFGLYLTLRKMNPAPYASWLHFGNHGPCVCCSSPERFLQLDRSGTLEAKPIKGTLPRGSSQVEDERLRYELQHSEKDHAENLMIVDLLRNDLGRVSVPGSVHVPSLMAVESYTTVHTLVSTVRGAKRDDITPIKCIQAAFPGGSMTGAPKLRTMEILDSIESGPRGVYSGTVGFLSFNSSFDLNIVIRTLVFSEGEVSIGAGGAVTALSNPDAEYEEMLLKTRAPIRAMAKFEGDYGATNGQGQRGPAASAVPT